jgi:thioredoxin reductase
VVVVDSGDPRNWETRGINGYLGHHGIRSPELRAIGREEGAKFGVDYVSGIVEEAINETGELFTIRLREGAVIEAQRILLAIGIKDVWPDIPGLDRCYGETIHVCPDCDGYETRDKKTVVVGKGRKAVGMALALTTWTSKIVICTNGEKPDMEQKLLDQLKALNIPLLDQPIKCVVSKSSEISGIDLDGGMSLDCERLYFAIGQYPADDLGAQLGCKRDEMGRLVIDERNHTSVKNVYAAGDIAPGPQMAIVAAASGAVAAIAIHASLLPETRKLPPTTSA